MPDETQKYVKTLENSLGIASGVVANRMPGIPPIANAAGQADGKIQVHIDFSNMPVGVKTSAQSDGIATVRIARTAGPS
jgi:hypothetical protein